MGGPAVLVGLYVSDCVPSPEQRLQELAALLSAAGETPGEAFWQPARREGQARSAATWIGKGKVEEIAAHVEETEAGLAVFDAELTPAQIRNLEEALGCRVLDRSELILDIFAGRARTRSAVLQVELAQLEYTAPRLRGMWTHLARQAGSSGGFVGSRGPGEKQIEIDRRIVSRRVARLKEEIATIAERRARTVKTRQDFTVGLVGYTNAGKTTLLSALTQAGVDGEDALFATLDTLTRRWRLPDGTDVVLSDTVGFVRALPHHLVASFRATLEEAVHADLRLHIIDAAHPLALEQVRAVRGVLEELQCHPARTQAVLNKVDLATAEALIGLRAECPDALEVSAVTGAGLGRLAEVVSERTRVGWIHVRCVADAGDGRVRAFAHEHGRVLAESWEDERWTAELLFPRGRLEALAALGATLTRDA